MADLDICPLEELPPGTVKIVRDGELDIGVYNLDGELYALEDRCSHDDGPLCEGDFDLEDGFAVCPRHGAHIDIRTGKALTLPAYLPVDTFRVKVESEGITEQVRSWRTDVVARIVSELGLENVMFEAAEPEVFSWYVKSYGPEVNLFVDHSQIVQLECLRSGIWGTQSLWGRVLTYRP